MCPFGLEAPVGSDASPDRRAAASPPAGVAPLVAEYCCWARQHRGTKDSTLAGYVRELNLLVAKIGEQPARFTSGKIRAFILERGQDFPSGDAQKPISAVRGFLRFLAARGQIASSLVGAVPTLAHWRGQRLFSVVTDREVRLLLESCDRRTALGLRDHATLLVLARLALRPGDVAQLRLGDIDWKSGCLCVCGKARRAERLPLPQEVGDSILRYLERARPRCCDDHVFLSARAPLRALTRYGVSMIVRRAIRRSGIKTDQQGAYLLRHSTATSLLARGYSLQIIGAILRHRSLETSARYTKLDVKLLRSVALPWPKEVL